MKRSRQGLSLARRVSRRRDMMDKETIFFVIAGISIFFLFAHMAGKLNNNKDVGKIGVLIIFVCCIFGFMLVTWLISAGIMIPLEYGYKKLGWFVFVLPVIVVVVVGWICSAFEGKRLP